MNALAAVTCEQTCIAYCDGVHAQLPEACAIEGDGDGKLHLQLTTQDARSLLGRGSGGMPCVRQSYMVRTSTIEIMSTSANRNDGFSGVLSGGASLGSA